MLLSPDDGNKDMLMRKSTIFLFGIFSVLTSAQETMVVGSVIDGTTLAPIPNVIITIEETLQTAHTDAEGKFNFITNVPLGEQILKVEKAGYITKRYPIIVYEGQTLDISDMMLDINVADSADMFIITLSDDELNDDTSGGADNISGLLHASQDVYQRTVAFEFSSSFFKLRGLDSENSSVLINGVEMNKLYNGRPEWSNWGGLNDVLRNQELFANLTPSNYTFGGILGSTHITIRASEYRQGGRITYSSSDRSYTNRVIASYATGLMNGGWSISTAVGRRWGAEGFQEATLYDSNSFFASVEKKINDQHSLNFSSFYAPNKRGKSSPNTQEVYDLKGTKYNEYWGYQNGEKRNSRIKEVKEPVFLLNHYWNLSAVTTLNTNIAYQFGKVGHSRLDYPGGGNPSSAYYQKLPSYALADKNGPDHAKAYQLEQAFIKDGQIDWNRIYDANITNADSGLNAAYTLYEDRNDDTQWTANTIITSDLTEHITLHGAVNYRHLKSENFAEIKDLLAATGVLNVDHFDNIQYDLQHPNRIVGEGDRFRYNYNLYAKIISGFGQVQFKFKKIDYFAALSVSNTTYQREGLYQHEIYASNSFGKGETLRFTGLGAKAGMTYKISGKHVVDVNAGYLSKAPSLRNTYANPRENHNLVKDITEEKMIATEASYIFRSAIVKTKLTGYYAKIKDANKISFYYADGLSSFEISENQTSAFVQEITQGIDKRHFGLEFGIEAQVTSAIKLKGVASLGQFTYANNPNLYLTSSSFANPSGIDFGATQLKNYKLASGPQSAGSVGFEYRDPEYWWFGATVNFFDNTYIDINPLTRTRNFYADADGLPFNDYDPEVAKQLLTQEKFNEYMIVNLVGGKSWKVNQYFIGFFASVNNLLDVAHKTGGFEQGRNANYRALKKDAALELPVFGSKYWYGRGTTYFLNAHIRF